jgi:hypothetical protein
VPVISDGGMRTGSTTGAKRREKGRAKREGTAPSEASQSLPLRQRVFLENDAGLRTVKWAEEGAGWGHPAYNGGIRGMCYANRGSM